MLTVWDAIKVRRSIRKFAIDDVPDEMIEQMLEAARLAPSGGNRQPWRFLVVRDREIRQQIREFTPAAGNILRNPIDYSQTVDDVAKLSTTASIVSQWDDIDFIVGFLTPERASPGTKRLLFNIIDGISQGSRAGSKPMGLVIEPSLRPEEASYIFPLIQRGVASGLPVYFSFDGVASAINTVLNYYENRRSRSET